MRENWGSWSPLTRKSSEKFKGGWENDKQQSYLKGGGSKFTEHAREGWSFLISCFSAHESIGDFLTMAAFRNTGMDKVQHFHLSFS